MRRLNGWQRIGVVLSVAWAIGAFAFADFSQIAADEKADAAFIRLCVPMEPDDPHLDCAAEAEKKPLPDRRVERTQSAAAAVIPLPIGWGLAYAALALSKWIRAGFRRRKDWNTVAG